jgi:hypothetical protein
MDRLVTVGASSQSKSVADPWPDLVEPGVHALASSFNSTLARQNRKARLLKPSLL